MPRIRNIIFRAILLLQFVWLSSLVALPGHLRAQSPEPVVHIVLFYLPTCVHCHELINNHLIPLQEQYGDDLNILALDVSQDWANNIYQAAMLKWEIPQIDWVVPIVLMNDELLVGGQEIPNRLRELLAQELDRDGVDLPDFPALLEFLEGQGMLDHRFPGRRIILQENATRDTPPPPDPEEAGPADTSEVSTITPGDQDSVSVAGAEVVDPPVEETETGRPATEVQDSQPVTEEGESDPAPAEVDEDPPAATVEAGDSSPEPSDTLAGDALSPDSGVEMAGDSAPDSPSGLGLAQAVQEMDSMTMWDRFNQDPRGNSASVVVLAGLILSLLARGFPPRARGSIWPNWVIPTLVLIGTGVAAYLSYIEITHSDAVCGPVGDCNTVNQSSWATLFGFLPVGVLGLMGYGTIMALWLARQFGSEALNKPASVSLWGAALFGTLFSVYLTFLEPFVIGATCIWCLSSAVIMAVLLWATAPLAAEVWPGSNSPESP